MARGIRPLALERVKGSFLNTKRFLCTEVYSWSSKRAKSLGMPPARYLNAKVPECTRWNALLSASEHVILNNLLS